jgi:hypothetical protein
MRLTLLNYIWNSWTWLNYELNMTSW